MIEPKHALISTRSEFHSAIRTALAEAAQTGCRELWLSDEDFADWPLNDADVIESLAKWALPHRKLVLLARSFDEVTRRHPRWVDWRRTWAHVVECRANEDAEVGTIPTLLVGSSLVCVRLADRVHCRGSISYDKGDILRTGESFDAVLQRSVEAFPASVLGL